LCRAAKFMATEAKENLKGLQSYRYQLCQKYAKINELMTKKNFLTS